MINKAANAQKILLFTGMIVLAGCAFSGTSSSILDCRQQGSINTSLNCLTELAIKNRIISICDYGKNFASSCQEKFLNQYPDSECKSDSCILNTAKSSEECEKISAPTVKDECIAKNADLESATANCEKSEQDNFKWLCYGAVAGFHGSTDICEKIPSEQKIFVKNCYTRAAKKLLKTESCNKITSLPDRETCTYTAEIVRGNDEICNNYSGISHDSCLFRLAEEKMTLLISSKNSSISSLPENSQISPQEKTQADGAFSLCNQISDSSLRLQCRHLVIISNDEFPESCDLLKESTSLYEHCLEQTARTNSDCRKISDKKTRESCLNELKIQRIDFSPVTDKNAQ